MPLTPCQFGHWYLGLKISLAWEAVENKYWMENPCCKITLASQLIQELGWAIVICSKHILGSLSEAIEWIFCQYMKTFFNWLGMEHFCFVSVLTTGINVFLSVPSKLLKNRPVLVQMKWLLQGSTIPHVSIGTIFALNTFSTYFHVFW